MLPSCPISLKRVDTNIVRLISLQVVLLTAVLLTTHALLVAWVLFLDFFIRTVEQQRYSPLYRIATLLAKLLKLTPNYSDAAPKKFALIMGFAMTSLLFVVTLFELTPLLVVISVVLLVCAMLEMLFDYCIGCKIYHFLELFKLSVKQTK